MIGALKWFRKEEESREDKLSRLAAELRSMTEEEKRRFIRRVWPEAHYAVNPPKGVPKKRKALVCPDPQDFETPEAYQEAMEKYQMAVEARMEGDR
jgi:hypothetical protein